MSQSRRRSDRPGPALRRFGSGLEVLESRQLLSGGTTFSFYNPNDPSFPTNPGNVPVSTALMTGISTATADSLGNSGKTVSGQDRLGDKYTITVNGPGEVIVTDATPNDGVLDDDISTITIVGSNPNTTTVTGTVVASDEVQSEFNQVTVNNPVDQPGVGSIIPTTGQVLFNKLVALSGVKSIVLDGFVLAQTVLPPSGLPDSDTGVFLYGGARNLDFTGIEAPIDQSIDAQPIEVMDGNPEIPLKFKPNVRIDEIANTVFNSTTTIVPSTPQTTPTVDIQINGESGNLQFVSITQERNIPSAEQTLFPTSFTTGRTAIQTKGINNLRVSGSANNTSVSQTAQPFATAFAGVSHIGTATFGGTADGLAINVKGRLGRLTLAKGLGNPANQPPGNATDSGTPAQAQGNPSNSLLGGLISAGSIGKVTVGAASTTLVTSNNPADIQTSPGSTRYFAKAGKALNYSAIVSNGNIESVKVNGDLTRSEIKAGYSIVAAEQGLPTTTGASKIKKLKVNGDLVDSVVSASYQPAAAGYGAPGSVAGAGSINGTFTGTVINTGLTTALGNLGSGFYARVKSPTLSPGQAPGTTGVPG
jgi:hypothetical protein